MNGVPPLTSMALRAAIFVLLVAMTAFGQEKSSTSSQAPSPETAPYIPTLAYDVVSVRECPPGAQAIAFDNPAHSGRLRGTCVWAEQLVGLAYGVSWADRVLGGPGWVRTEQSNEVRFSVQATSDSATDDKLAKLGNHDASLEKEHMLQQLLADRFKLKAHLEIRDKPALALLIAKGGPRMQTGDPAPRPIESQIDPRGVQIDGHGATMGRLARLLELYLRKSVVDQTGLSDTFNFDLKFHGSLSDMTTEDGTTWPPIETAIQPLGLEVKSTNVSQKVVVIEHIEMPSPNQ